MSSLMFLIIPKEVIIFYKTFENVGGSTHPAGDSFGKKLCIR